MNELQNQLIENTSELPKKFLQEIVDFSEFVKQKVQNQLFKKRMEQSEKDIKEGRVKAVSPDELFKELDI
jgi:heme oxygenase